MASSIALQGTLLRSNFLGQNNFYNRPQKPYSFFPIKSTFRLKPCAKFNLFEIMGGRGLCNGEEGLEKELKRDIQEQTPPTAEENAGSLELPTTQSFPENAFEKELMGFTGGFPGGEKGLKKFIGENPPPKKQAARKSGDVVGLAISNKPKPPELPLLMPGMIAIVKNPNNPFYIYTGIVQRITDGKVGVLFEGGNWDRLITFWLDELQRREKGHPGKNPKSAVIEAYFQKEQK